MTGPQIFEGLEGVLVARTSLSAVDGARGTLTVRGYPIESLASRVPFEGMVGLLLNGSLPTPETLGQLRVELGAARQRAFARLAPRREAVISEDAMRSLATALSLLPSNASPFDSLGMAAVATAASVCRVRGADLAPPDPSLPHAHDLLRLLGERSPKEGSIRLLDAYLVTVAEHGFNASTFAARVTASTGADLASAVVSGVVTLSGPLHGGAPGPVLDMLDSVGSPEHASSFVRAELAAGRRIMGMGHRVYRVRDPRAFVLERALSEYQSAGGGDARLQLARAVEVAAEEELSRKYPGRALRANVEFYTALLLEALTVPRASFTAVFGCARVLGYAAHYEEQRREGRLIRPSALYVGKEAASANQ
jgi:citrate synthase